MSDVSPKLILASRSPRRRELLEGAGYRFEVRPAREGVESGPKPGEKAEDFVARAAREKAVDVARQVQKGLILGCDTVAQCGGRILGKPADEAEARQMLRTLAGRRHSVLSGVCLWDYPDCEPVVRVAETTLQMDSLSDRQLTDYLAGDGWRGKAGAFGYQGRLGWVHVVEGSETNVVGLPMELLAEMLREAMLREP